MRVRAPIGANQQLIELIFANSPLRLE